MFVLVSGAAMIMADVKTNLRLSEELYEAIKRLAAKEVRSINSQITVLLKEAIERRESSEEKK